MNLGLRAQAKRKLQCMLANIAKQMVAKEWSLLESTLVMRTNDLQHAPEIHPLLLKYLVLGEDRRHGRHLGFDPIAIARAFWRQLATNKREGASTICQQLVRTLTNRREHTIRRKLTEICLAILVTRHFSADQIAKVYLQVAYYGWQMNNLTQAFDRTGFDQFSLSDFQAAALVARLKYPQPRVTPLIRNNQIRCRVQHLIWLADSQEYLHSDPLPQLPQSHEALQMPTRSH